MSAIINALALGMQSITNPESGVRSTPNTIVLVQQHGFVETKGQPNYGEHQMFFQKYDRQSDGKYLPDPAGYYYTATDLANMGVGVDGYSINRAYRFISRAYRIELDPIAPSTKD